MVHLDAFMGQSKGGLKEHQAVLFLVGYPLLRPVSPWLGYIVGVTITVALPLTTKNTRLTGRSRGR